MSVESIPLRFLKKRAHMVARGRTQISKSVVTVIMLMGLTLPVMSCGRVDTAPITATESATLTRTSPDGSSLSFTLTEQGVRSFSVYLRGSDIFHFSMRTADGSEDLWFHLVTPRGEIFGSYHQGRFAGGTLEAHSAQLFSSYATSFSPSDFGWGQGNYSFEVQAHRGGTAIVDYWVQH